MPRLIVTDTARRGIERCRQFLISQNPVAAQQAADAIRKTFKRLQQTPEIGRLVRQDQNMRELLIPFGKSGYVALYTFDVKNNLVIVLAFRHQREAGY